MLRVDFHCHTMYSKDSQTRLESLLAVCHAKDLDRLVITDHNTIAGAIAAQRLDPEMFIVGEEIKTTQGELLAVFVQEEIPARLSPLETIRRLRSQGAFISVSHPFDEMRGGSWRLPALLEIAPLVDALEVFNAHCFFSSPNRRAQEFARQHDLPGTAGSDAHDVKEVGTASALLPDFHNAAELKQVIRQAQIEGRLTPPLVRIITRLARRQHHS